MNDLALIFGKSGLSHIVSVEPGEDTADVFRELENGTIEKTTVPNSHYILFAEQHSPKFKRLKGDQPYQWLYETTSREKYKEVLSASYKKRYDLYTIRDPKEALMVKDGYTYFKDMKVEGVSVLSFDIETSGLTLDTTAKVFLISNTFRKNGKVIRRLFSLDEYQNQATMLSDWANWVVEMNPSIVIGHNILSYDLPYLSFVAWRSGVILKLGRDNSALRFAEKGSVFRKDGSQAYDYKNAFIYGREIVDTWFLSIKFDTARDYPSYKLKEIVSFEIDRFESKKKEKPKEWTARDQDLLDRMKRNGNRTFYDASKIHEDWHNEEKRRQIKAYAIDDADDALNLFDLMIPSFFYYTQSVPRSLQQIVNTATGGQINSLMVRGYLQQGHSIARGSEAAPYEGAISFGNPGIHKNVLRLDVASLYPSIIIQYKIQHRGKDPQGLFLKLVEAFTLKRLNNKRLAKETGDRYYEDLAQSQKIVINSCYGFLGAPKVNYNYPEGAAEVTHHGRRILKQAIKFLTGKEYEVAS